MKVSMCHSCSKYTSILLDGQSLLIGDGDVEITIFEDLLKPPQATADIAKINDMRVRLRNINSALQRVQSRLDRISVYLNK